MSSFKSDKDGFDLGKYADQRVRVKFTGGREVDGVLKGFDKLDNLVLDECTEFIRGMYDVFNWLHNDVVIVYMFVLTCLPLPPLLLSLYAIISPMADPEDPTIVTDEKRVLGLVVCRGTQVCLISPSDGLEEIANPFGEEEEGADEA